MDIIEMFESSLLAQMVYAGNLNGNKEGIDLVAALTDSEDGADFVTDAQAEYFAANKKGDRFIFNCIFS